MKILFSGNDFKYETEATVKLFIPSRFTFHYDITDAERGHYNDAPEKRTA